ncbi:hypothetical protein [Actinomadura coerulea]|uniref:hypothetical protein n=1 Tax=Actinomadura coerulea TaxID=46159 RepID=UPI003423F354
MITIERETDLKANEVGIGVDTHHEINLAVVLDDRGRRLGDATVPTTRTCPVNLGVWLRAIFSCGLMVCRGATA